MDSLRDWLSVASSVVTIAAVLVGGIWALWRFVLAQEKYPNVEFSADINVIGKQNQSLIVELIALLENKGKAQHRMKEFSFDLNALFPGDPVLSDERWGGQVNFPHLIGQGSFLPAEMAYFFVDPGTKAKYSYVARVPQEATFLILHCRFTYVKRGRTAHAAEKTLKVQDIA